MSNERKQLTENLRKLLQLKDYKSDRLMKETIEMFSLSFRRKIVLTLLFIFLFFVTKFILFEEKSAIEIISSLTNNMNAIIIPMFAVIITGFAIFQAIANEETILVMLRVTHKGKESKFAVYNKYFFGIAILYLIIVVINTVLQFIFSNMSKNWSLEIFDDCFNEVLAAFMINLYFMIIINSLIELKSFTYNLFQVFITSTAATGLKTLENMEENNDNDL